MDSPDGPPWRPLPVHVAALLGRLAYNAAWLDDRLSEAVVYGNPHVTLESESTPGWAESGAALVAAVRGISVDHEVVSDIADRLDDLTQIRNQLIHGVWLWEHESALIIKRARGKGERSHDYVTYTYDEIDQLVAVCERLGGIADRLAKALREANPATHEMEALATPACSEDGSLMVADLVDEEIVWICPQCGKRKSAAVR